MAFTQDQVMLALSFAAYTGLTETEPAELYRALRAALDALRPIVGKQEIVWGPASHNSKLELVDDAFVFVTRSERPPTEPPEYCVVIRGTHPISLVSWLFEDLWVKEQCPWISRTAPSDALISHATLNGMMRLTELMRPAKGLPGESTFLKPFLDEIIARHDGRLTLDVTGHSLGGVMASTLAVWFTEVLNKADWTAIRCYAFAGPTAGNAAFAEYSNRVLGNACSRYSNAYDVVTHAWNERSLRDLVSLYSPCHDHALFDMLVGRAAEAVQGLGYEQISRLVRTDGAFVQAIPEFALQMVYQHIFPYFTALFLDSSAVFEATHFFDVLNADPLGRSLLWVLREGPGRSAAPESLDQAPVPAVVLGAGR